jgi:probable phosphoglycerate mutase
VKVILVRHCETDRSRDGRVQGISDPPLTDFGCHQALILAKHLSALSIQAIYSSPLQRAMQTALPIAAALNLEVEIEPGLIELDAGELDGLTGAEMRERHPEFMRAWADGTGRSARLPGGESLQDLQQRAWGFLQSLGERTDLEAAVCVTHNFVVLTAIAQAIRLPLANLSRLQHGIANFSIIDFRNGRVQVNKFNETCHLLET